MSEEDYRVVLKEPAKELNREVFSYNNVDLQEYLEKELSHIGDNQFLELKIIEGEELAYSDIEMPHEDWFKAMAGIYFMLPHWYTWMRLKQYAKKNIICCMAGIAQPKDINKRLSNKDQNYYFDIEKRIERNYTSDKNLRVYMEKLSAVLSSYILSSSEFSFVNNKHFKFSNTKEWDG